jgi:hypothetical protein
MANVNFAHKDFWFNEDGSIADVVFEPIDPTAQFTAPSFLTNALSVDSFRDSSTAELSQLIFGDDRLESESSRTVGSFRKNFSRDVVEPSYNAYVVNNAAPLTGLVWAADPEQIERHILARNRSAKNSAFKLELPEDATDEQRAAVERHNTAVDAVDAYHVEVGVMNDVGDNAYVAGRLNNVTPMQMAVIRSATGSRPGDNSRIAKSYKSFHAATAMEAVKGAGIVPFIGNNLARANRLQVEHQGQLENLEAAVDMELVNLGPGATREERTGLYRWAEEQSDGLAVAYQNAATDAKYVISDLANKAKDVVLEATRNVGA